jgi:hypothetical protein
MELQPRPVPPDPQAEPASPRERARHWVLATRAVINGPAFAAMRGGLRLASPLGPPFLLKMLVRPQWLFEAAPPIPRRDVTFTGPAERSEVDRQLCERIARAYQKACDDDIELSPIWVGKLGRYYGRLDAALRAADAEALNDQLRWMFRRPFLAGISTPIDYEDPAAPRYWALMTYDRLVSLAEAVGAIRVECPEQGPVGRAFAEGIETLPARIEGKLGISLDYPRVGAPYGITIGDRLITRETGQHLHAAVRLRDAIEAHLQRSPGDDVDVLELGGGFAGAAMWYLRLSRAWAGSYTIVDLPLMNAVQAYFLGQIYGPDALQLFGEQDGGSPIRIFPPRALRTGTPISADVVFNQDSMPEMSGEAARGYLAWMQERVSGLFVSHNQEAATPVDGIPQLVVGELVGEFDQLERISRQPSWVRRGYVEEIYRCGKG